MLLLPIYIEYTYWNTRCNCWSWVQPCLSPCFKSWPQWLINSGQPFQSTAEAGKKSRVCLSVLDIMIFSNWRNKPALQGNYELPVQTTWWVGRIGRDLEECIESQRAVTSYDPWQWWFSACQIASFVFGQSVWSHNKSLKIALHRRSVGGR